MFWFELGCFGLGLTCFCWVGGVELFLVFWFKCCDDFLVC